MPQQRLEGLGLYQAWSDVQQATSIPGGGDGGDGGMNVIAPQLQRPRRQGICPRIFVERIGHRAPGKVPLNVGSEELRQLRPVYSRRRQSAGRHRDCLQPRVWPQTNEKIPGRRHAAALAVEVADESCLFQFGNEARDGAGVDGPRLDLAQARPAGKTRQAIAHAPVVCSRARRARHRRS